MKLDVADDAADAVARNTYIAAVLYFATMVISIVFWAWGARRASRGQRVVARPASYVRLDHSSRYSPVDTPSEL